MLITSSQSSHSQGAFIEWNKDGGSGKTYLLNQKGLGSGVIIVGEVDNANNVTEHLRMEFNGNTGIGSLSPQSRLEVNGPIATTMANLAGVTVTLDNTAAVWNFTVNTQIGLPDAGSCINRLYVLVNRYSAVNFISGQGYIDLDNILRTSINANSSIEIISDGSNWLQIK